MRTSTLSIAFNPKFASGLASSLSVGLSAMPGDVVGALVLLGDMPWIEPRLIDALIDAFLARKDALAAVPSHEGRRGNPVLLGRGLFDAAMRLTGDEGARRLIGALSGDELVEVEASDMGVTFDIDTPDDLAAAQCFRGATPSASAIRAIVTPKLVDHRGASRRPALRDQKKGRPKAAFAGVCGTRRVMRGPAHCFWRNA